MCAACQEYVKENEAHISVNRGRDYAVTKDEEDLLWACTLNSYPHKGPKIPFFKRDQLSIDADRELEKKKEAREKGITILGKL